MCEKENDVFENEMNIEDENINSDPENTENNSEEPETTKKTEVYETVENDEDNIHLDEETGSTSDNLPHDTENQKKKTWIYLFIGVVLAGIAIIAFALSRPTHVEDEPIDYLACIEGIKEEMSIQVGTDPKKIDFMSFVKFDNERINKVTVDSSKLDLTKEGKYDVVYHIDVKDENAEDFDLTTKVTVIPKEKAEELAEKGDEVVTDNGIQNEKPATPASKPSSGSSSSSGSSKPSGGSSSSSNSGSSNTPSNKPSGGNSGNSNTGNSESQKPSHTHTWVQQYKTVHHEEVGHNEKYVIKDAWTETIPVYEMQERSICNGCGADITGNTTDHIREGALNGTSCRGYHSEWKQIQTGTETINHPAEYGTRWVVDQAAWDEQVKNGFKCSCGATK